MQKIDITKQYRTRDGREVKLWTTEARDVCKPVIGEVLDRDGRWALRTWGVDGKWLGHDTNDLDLIEVVPRWSGKLWVHPDAARPILRFLNEPSEYLVNQGYRLIDAQEVLPND